MGKHQEGALHAGVNELGGRHPICGVLWVLLPEVDRTRPLEQSVVQ